MCSSDLSDVDPERVEEARANAEHAGVAEWVRCEVADARALAPKRGWNAWIVTNAPYGERVGEARELPALYRAFGARLRVDGVGSTLAVLTLEEHLRSLGLPELRRVALENGGLECVLGVGTI